MPRADDPTFRARAIRQAMLQPEHYLAAALAELPDEDLAAAIGADPAKVWRLRLCGWPRPAHWGEDAARMAELVGANAALLAGLLVRVGVEPP
jgi:1,6-anhydro-N-acetylmuramate kinase